MAEEELAGVDATLSDESVRPTRSEEDPDPRLIRFKSARNSAADWQRRSASFSRHLSTTSFMAGGSNGFKSVGGAGSFWRIAWKMTAEVAPSKGSRPVDI